MYQHKIQNEQNEASESSHKKPSANLSSGLAAKGNQFIQTKLQVGAVNEPLELEAESIAQAVAGMPEASVTKPGKAGSEEGTNIQSRFSIPFIQKSAENRNASQTEIASGEIEPGSSVGDTIPSTTKTFMESRFRSDFSNVRIHSNSAAADLSQNLNAKAFTLGNHIYFNQGQYQPNSSEGKQLLAHELTHTLQQSNNPASKKIQRAPLPTDLSSFPEIDRRRIQISWVAVNATSGLPSMNESFGTTAATAGGTAVSSNKGNGSVVFGNNIPATPSTSTGFDVRHGLNNIAHHLENSTNILPLNSTITITLDLTPFGGSNGNYRFSYFQHASGTGTAATLDEVTLIEQLGPATRNPTVANPGNAATAGTFTFGGQSFVLGTGWTLQQQAIVNQALALVPPKGITQLAGVTFNLGAGSGTEEGHYNEETHAITIQASAFDNRLNAYRGGSDAVRIILHEIAHAIDRTQVRTAWSTYTAGGQTPAGKIALERTRSLSGSSYVFDPAQNEHILQEGAAATAFRNAVIQDRTQRGVALPTGVTTYSSTNWEENFAEAFSMYMADRALFQQLRPHTFSYFQLNYP